jgi:gliding motility-associated-like protein
MKFRINYPYFFTVLLLTSKLVFAGGYTVSKDSICGSARVYFKDTSSVPSGLAVQSREWNFGIGTTVTGIPDTISYLYAANGSYNTSLKINYSNGTNKIVLLGRNIEVFLMPTAGISLDKTVSCPSHDVFNTGLITFSNTSLPGSGIITTYRLDFGDGSPISNNSGTVSHDYLFQGTYTVTQYIMDQYGCSDQTTRQVTMLQNPTVSFTPNKSICKDSVILFKNTTKNMSSFLSWNWMFHDNDGTVTTIVQNNTQDAYHAWIYKNTQKVILIGTNQYGCIDADTQFVFVDTTPIFSITPSVDTAICLGQTVQYLLKNAQSYLWESTLFGNFISGDSNIVFKPKNTIEYKVRGKTNACISDYKSIKISVAQDIETVIKMQPDSIIFGSKSDVKINIKAVYDSIKWSPKEYITCYTCDTNSFSPPTSAYAIATVYYSLGQKTCTHTDSAFLFVDNTCTKEDITIPNAFTPNGDETNDIFYVKGYPLKDILDFKIYDRWGVLMYSATNIKPNDSTYGWNGKRNNNDAEQIPGVYIYKVQAKCANNQLLNFQGEVTLIR